MCTCDLAYLGFHSVEHGAAQPSVDDLASKKQRVQPMMGVHRQVLLARVGLVARALRQACWENLMCIVTACLRPAAHNIPMSATGIHTTCEILSSICLQFYCGPPCTSPGRPPLKISN
jgi:hypothetical protein